MTSLEVGGEGVVSVVVAVTVWEARKNPRLLRAVRRHLPEGGKSGVPAQWQAGP